MFYSPRIIFVKKKKQLVCKPRKYERLGERGVYFIIKLEHHYLITIKTCNYTKFTYLILAFSFY